MKFPHEAVILCGTQRGQAAIRMGDWKLIVGARGKTRGEQATATDPLYHLATDIGESRNVAADQPEKLKELGARYDQMMSTAAPSGEVAGGLKE